MVGADGSVRELVLEIGEVQLLQRLLDVGNVPYAQATIIENDTGEALGELGVHPLARGSTRELWPSWDGARVPKDTIPGDLCADVGQSAERDRVPLWGKDGHCERLPSCV
jgi:hypothetical protein